MMSAMTEFVLEDEGEMTHDCVTLTYAATSEIAETPIENAELELFVDGSAQVIEGNRRAGYAVLCQGRKTWTHVSHCKVVPPPTGIG